MSALPDRSRLAQAPRSTTGARRPVLQVVSAPEPSRRTLPYAIGLVAVLFFSMVFALLLNTSMAQTAFVIQDRQVELESLQQREASLRAQVETAASPAGLEKTATDLGMVPAESVEHLRLSDGSILATPDK